MTDAQAIYFLAETFESKKFVNVAELLTKFSKYDLELLLECSTIYTKGLGRAIIDNDLEELELDIFEAFALKGFIESQMMFINRAIKHNNTNFDGTSIEGNVLEFTLNEN